MSDEYRYSKEFVLKLLNLYNLLQAYEPIKDPDDDEQNYHSFRAPFENVVCFKADIDRAIEHLNRTQKAVVKWLFIEGYKAEEIGRKINKDSGTVLSIANSSVSRMVRFLNGKEK